MAATDIAKTLWDFPAIDPRTAIIAVDPGLYCIIPDEIRAEAAREIERMRDEIDLLQAFRGAVIALRSSAYADVIAENARLQAAKRRALAIADERGKEACDLRAENARLRVIAADYHALNSRANSIGDDLALMQKEAGRLNLTVELQRQEIGKLRAAIDEIRTELPPPSDYKGWQGECFRTIGKIVDQALVNAERAADDAELARMSDIPLLRGGPGLDYPCAHPDMTECGHAECQRLRRCKDQHFGGDNDPNGNRDLAREIDGS